jgi:phosphatidylserine synthase 2
MTNLLSVTFEFLEYSLEHQLANFSECWWDHWIMDVLVCNLSGIVIGNIFLKTLENKEYNWIGLRNQVGYPKKMKRIIGQFSPYSWVTFSWQPKANIFRWVCVSMIIIMILLTELNCFYLKFVMWAQPDHPYVLGRLCFMACMGAVALREAYDYLSGISKEIGPSAWTCISIVITEAMICCKFGWETVMMPFPAHVKIFWSIMLSGYVLWSFWPLWRVKIDTEKPVDSAALKKDE